MPESAARRRDRDLLSRSRLELDALEPHEAATYRSGTWLGPRITSARLQSLATKRNHHSDLAELAARSRVQAERLASS